MDIKSASTTYDDSAPQDGSDISRLSASRSWHLPFIEIIISSCLAIAAFIPRILLAIKLDIVNDEAIYILGGKIYLPLAIHLNIGASGWSYNYEHPPFVKLLIGLALATNSKVGHPLNDLLAARMPSVIFGTLLVVAIYVLGRAPFGRVVALLAALCLAFSPWLVYFSALAYLDMTMTTLVTIVYLLLWHAIRHPWLYLLSALLTGLAAASKYTASLAVPGMVLFTAYYFLAIRPHLPIEQRPKVPWLWWLGTIALAPLAFLIADPAIWPHPLGLLLHSFLFEWEHSIHGHLTFIAGQYALHVPQWAILYIIFAKMSAFVTIPATFFAIFALVRLIRFHLARSKTDITEVTTIAFLFIWMTALLSMFSLLNIVVGTHYHLPIAPPVALAGAFGLATLLRYRRGSLFTTTNTASITIPAMPQAIPLLKNVRFNLGAAIIFMVLAMALVGPHLLGLATTYEAEGYTSEFFSGENTVLQVAYPGYREALQWLEVHAKKPGRVGLVALPETLSAGASWYSFNTNLFKRFVLNEAHPTDKAFPYDYLVWPMHLVQRGYTIPANWHARIVHSIMGGNTTYCYIMAYQPATISQ